MCRSPAKSKTLEDKKKFRDEQKEKLKTAPKTAPPAADDTSLSQGVAEYAEEDDFDVEYYEDDGKDEDGKYTEGEDDEGSK